MLILTLLVKASLFLLVLAFALELFSSLLHGKGHALGTSWVLSGFVFTGDMGGSSPTRHMCGNTSAHSPTHFLHQRLFELIYCLRLFIKVLSVQCLLAGLCEIGRPGPRHLLLSLLLVELGVEFVLLLLELLPSHQLVNLRLKCIVFARVDTFRWELFLLL